MSPLDATRDDLLHVITSVALDEFDSEDARDLADLLLEGFTAMEALTWMSFFSPELDAVPLLMLQNGRSRELFAHARGMVEQASG